MCYSYQYAFDEEGVLLNSRKGFVGHQVRTELSRVLCFARIGMLSLRRIDLTTLARRSQGKYEEAEDSHKRSCAIRESP